MTENYSYHPETGEYLGAIPFSGNPGAMPPRNTTPLRPDNIPGCVPVWMGAEWAQLEDHRGRQIYKRDASASSFMQELGPIPDDCTLLAPPLALRGHAVRFDAEKGEWTHIEDHRGEEGYVNGEAVTITELGPLPDGWQTELPPPEPEPPDPAEVCRAEILRELNAIDRNVIRPLRAVVARQLAALAAGNGTDDDTVIVQQLDARAADLRIELAAFGAPNA